MSSPSPEAALSRVLAGLERELVEASDEEIVQAAEDLGMNLRMKGSAAFIGLVHAIPKRLSDFFDLEELRRDYLELLRRQRSELPPGGGDRDEGER